MRAIVSVVNGGGIYATQYERGLARLEASAERLCPEIKRFIWKQQWPPGSRSHEASLYGFKMFAFKYAFEQGYRQILWLDSRAHFVKHPEPIFYRMRQHGTYFQPCAMLGDGNFCNDAALALFSLTRKEALAIPLIAGSVYGLDLEKEKVFDMYKEALALESAGAFTGNRATHRGDECTWSFLLHKHKLTLCTEGFSDGPVLTIPQAITCCGPA